MCLRNNDRPLCTMNVPFISSGALSRVHYALVRNIEEATSEAAANRMLESEVKSIRLQLAQPGLSPVRATLLWVSVLWLTSYRKR
jgi:hypothetical protein